jgi:hypothetical protein
VNRENHVLVGESCLRKDSANRLRLSIFGRRPGLLTWPSTPNACRVAKSEDRSPAQAHDARRASPAWRGTAGAGREAMRSRVALRLLRSCRPPIRCRRPSLPPQGRGSGSRSPEPRSPCSTWGGTLRDRGCLPAVRLAACRGEPRGHGRDLSRLRLALRPRERLRRRLARAAAADLPGFRVLRTCAPAAVPLPRRDPGSVRIGVAPPIDRTAPASATQPGPERLVQCQARDEFARKGRRIVRNCVEASAHTE